MVARLAGNQNLGFVGLVGVQSNEFPDAFARRVTAICAILPPIAWHH